jgi:hypothetical protein
VLTGDGVPHLADVHADIQFGDRQT